MDFTKIFERLKGWREMMLHSRCFTSRVYSVVIKSDHMPIKFPSRRNTFVQRRPNVFDASPTLYKCYTNVLRYWEQTIVT